MAKVKASRRSPSTKCGRRSACIELKIVDGNPAGDETVSGLDHISLAPSPLHFKLAFATTTTTPSLMGIGMIG
jgi:hypothetical protein